MAGRPADGPSDRPVAVPAAGADDPPWPDDAVEVGRILDAYGIKGWLRVQPLAADPQALFSSKRWFLAPPEGPSSALRAAVRPQAWPRVLRVVQAREQGDGIVASAQGFDDRTAAESLRGARIFVSRASFPTADADEYYWVDLIGLAVHNREGALLGTVAGLIDTGPHSVLRITPPADAQGLIGEERLVPFVGAYVDRVSLPDRRIDVDWGLDY